MSYIFMNKPIISTLFSIFVQIIIVTGSEHSELYLDPYFYQNKMVSGACGSYFLVGLKKVGDNLPGTICRFSKQPRLDWEIPYGTGRLWRDQGL